MKYDVINLTEDDNMQNYLQQQKTPSATNNYTNYNWPAYT